MGAYAKAIVAGLITGLAALQQILAHGGGVTGAEWAAIAIAAVTPVAVFVVPNMPASLPLTQPSPTPSVLPTVVGEPTEGRHS